MPVELLVDIVKQGLPATVVVRSAASEASCGVELKGHVTVFAHGDNDALNATLQEER